MRRGKSLPSRLEAIPMEAEISRLIIAEKEEAAEAIAAILSGGSQERRRFNGEV